MKFNCIEIVVSSHGNIEREVRKQEFKAIRVASFLGPTIFRRDPIIRHTQQRVDPMQRNPQNWEKQPKWRHYEE